MPFQLPDVPGSTSSKTIRFPDDIIQGVENVIRGTNVNFSQFVIAATKAALEDLKKENSDC